MPPRGWTIRDADYDVDKLGYGLIKSKTILYHATLLAKSKSLAKGDDPSAEDVEQAETDIHLEVYHRLKRQEIQKRGRLPSFRDLAIAVGGVLIGAFISKVIEIAVSQLPIVQLHWPYWISLVIGLICFIPYLRSDP